MSKFIINGGKPLKGEVEIKGSKNSTLPIIAASILLPETHLHNVPRIGDVFSMLEIIDYLGGSHKWLGENELVITTDGLINKPLNEVARKLRTSILFAGSMLAKFGKVELPHPGGDNIGSRPLDAHIDSFKALGIKVYEDTMLTFDAPDHPGGEFLMDEPSVTATENLLIYAAAISKPVTMKLVATEPHIQALCHFLVAAGAQIEGIGTTTLKIHGTEHLKSTSFDIIPDGIEAVSFIAMAAATHGDILIKNLDLSVLDSVLLEMNKMNINYKIEGKDLHILPPVNPYRSIKKLQSGLHPKLASDYLPPLAVLATQAEGATIIHDWMYEARQSYINELYKMGANTVIMDPHRSLIIGPTPLRGTEVTSYDIRAGMALIIAALAAEGQTTILGIDHIDRGYENIDGRLRELGADIAREI